MNNGYKKYSKIFDVAEYTARKWYKEYDILFLSAGMEAEDIVQETQLKAVEIIKRNPDKKYSEVFKLSNRHIKWRLHDLLDRARKNTVVLKQSSNGNGKHDRTIPRVKFSCQDEESKREELQERVLIPVEFDENTMTRNGKRHVFNFQELHSVLDQREYFVLYQVMHNGISMRNVAKKLHCSRKWAYHIYNQAIKKAEKYLEEQKELGLKIF
jgi:uncharacterized DUF497 family protein